ncbi:MAG: hypothetical protein LR008_03065 [Candidatus Pacebacteria bacterium]|nr:hypothetical protein [Candidatus Paceibacterota bacterium]
MKNQRLWAYFLYLVPLMGLSIGIFAALPASAQSELPSSANPATTTPWKSMHAGSFEPGLASAREQCERAAYQSETDKLTISQCLQFESMLANGQCESVQVPDGIIHDFMNYKRNEKKLVSRSVLKEHGHDTSALLCALSEGVYGYFYTGTKKHCNNVAFVLLPSSSTTIPILVDKEPTKTCRFVKREVVQSPSTFVSLPDFHTCGCYIPGVTAMVSGSIQSSSSMVCD